MHLPTVVGHCSWCCACHARRLAPQDNFHQIRQADRPCSTMLRYIAAAFHVYVYETLFQRLGMLDMPDLDHIGGHVEGLTAVITGPTSGIGWTTATALAKRGAHVVLACRNRSKADDMVASVRKQLAEEGYPPPCLEVQMLDLSDLSSVRAFAEAWRKQGRPLHLLINNAGVLNMTGGRTTTADGLETHMATNHLGHFLLTLGLLPCLQAGTRSKAAVSTAPWDPATRVSSAAAGGTHSPQGTAKQQANTAAAAAAGTQGSMRPFKARVVNVCSSTHVFGWDLSQDDPTLGAPGKYDAGKSYGRSKLSQISFSNELARRLGPNGEVEVLSLHPGVVFTGVVRSMPPLIQRLYALLLSRLLLSPEEGARATVYAATAPDAPAAAAATGGYLEANAKPSMPSAVARDPQVAAWLWEWSAAAVSLPPSWDLPAAAASK